MEVAVKRIFISMFFPGLLLLVIWVLFVAEHTLDLVLFFHGLYPRKISGLQGILLAPLIHGGLRHIFANSLPIFALGSLLFYFYPTLALKVSAVSYLLPGIIVWFVGRSSYHVGASAIIYSLAAFLFMSGLIRKHLGLMAVSLLVGLEYGTMIWGIFPFEEGISWESHLAGMITGLGLAVLYRKRGPKGFATYSQGLGHHLSEESDEEAARILPWDEYEVEGERKKKPDEREDPPQPVNNQDQ